MGGLVDFVRGNGVREDFPEDPHISGWGRDEYGVVGFDVVLWVEGPLGQHSS